MPVLEIAKAVYAFVAAHVLALLRLSWLPLLINALAGVITTLKLLPFLPALESGDAAQVSAIFAGPALGWIVMGMLVPLAMNGVIAVALLRYVVHGEKGTSGPVHVGFGWGELRVMAVTILIGLMVFFVTVPITLALSLFGSAGSQSAVAIVPLAAFAAMILLGARYLMAYPVAAIENRISLERAWSLMRGGYRRFLVLLIVVLLPVFVFDILVGTLIGPQADADATALVEAIESEALLLAGANFVSNFISAAVFFSTLGLVYRNLTAGRETKPAPHTI